MRQQIAAANWKMNGNYAQWDKLLNTILDQQIALHPQQQVLFAVPFPYLMEAAKKCSGQKGYAIASQNCHQKNAGAFTGEVSAEMISSIGISHCIVGHSERREYFNESNQTLAQKVDICLANQITPLFCCGEPLAVREKNEQDAYVKTQLQESLFHLSEEQLNKVIIAYEPIWAIGTGKTASSLQAQEMHASIRNVMKAKYGEEIAAGISILYGGSVKASNAVELFSQPDVDGGLVGGASLDAKEFCSIIQSLKK
jgi:triosephosphate isomerase